MFDKLVLEQLQIMDTIIYLQSEIDILQQESIQMNRKFDEQTIHSFLPSGEI